MHLLLYFLPTSLKNSICLDAMQHRLKMLKQQSPEGVMWSKILTEEVWEICDWRIPLECRLPSFGKASSSAGVDLRQQIGQRSFNDNTIVIRVKNIPIHLETRSPKMTYIDVCSAGLSWAQSLCKVLEIQTEPMQTSRTSKIPNIVAKWRMTPTHFLEFGSSSQMTPLAL